MASQEAIAVRRALVVQRLEAVSSTLAARYDLDVPTFTPNPGYDPELNRIMQMEATADLLEAVEGAVHAQEALAVNDFTVTHLQATQAATEALAALAPDVETTPNTPKTTRKPRGSK